MTAKTRCVTGPWRSILAHAIEAEQVSVGQVDAQIEDQATINSITETAEADRFAAPVWLIITFATGKQPTALQLTNWVNYLDSRVAELKGNGVLAADAFIQAKAEMTNAFAGSMAFESNYGVPGSTIITPGVAARIISTTQTGGDALNAQQQDAAAVWGTTGLTVSQVFEQFATNDLSFAANDAKIQAWLTNVSNSDEAAHVVTDTASITP